MLDELQNIMEEANEAEQLLPASIPPLVCPQCAGKQFVANQLLTVSHAALESVLDNATDCLILTVLLDVAFADGLVNATLALSGASQAVTYAQTELAPLVPAGGIDFGMLTSDISFLAGDALSVEGAGSVGDIAASVADFDSDSANFSGDVVGTYFQVYALDSELVADINAFPEASQVLAPAVAACQAAAGDLQIANNLGAVLPSVFDGFADAAGSAQQYVNSIRQTFVSALQIEQRFFTADIDYINCNLQPNCGHPPTPPPPPGPPGHGTPPQPRPPFPIPPEAPHDPNNIIGPAGFGAENFVSVGQALPYQINFENDPTAVLPAQQVVITQQLDRNLNPQSFRLGSFGFGGQVYQVPANTAFYQTQIDLTQQDGFNVDVTASIDVQTGIATWTFTTIDPATGEIPLDPTVGFLPPDNSAGIGEGFVSYTVMANQAASTGTVIYAQATVDFYSQPSIDTPQIFNTIDTGSDLTSTVAALPAVQNSPTFNVSWAGSDNAAGSAVSDYTVYVSDDGGPYTSWLEDTDLTSAPFTGQDGHTYSFYSVAADNAGNLQPTPSAPQVTTTVETSGTPPTSSVTALPPYENTTTFAVSWSGSDGLHGSGVASYSIYVSDDGGTFTPLLTGTTLTSTSFTGQDGHTYGFYSVATDNAGNVQATPTTAQTSTLVDVTPPTSSVTALPPYENTTTFAVSWSGSDGLHGSGVASYSIYVSDDGGTFTPLLTGTTLTSTSFTGQDGHTYGFYSVATDNAGNVQATPTTAQTSTLVDVTPPTSSVTALPPYENTTTFAVSWSGSDGLHGSGVASYSIYVSDDGGTFTPLLTGTTLTSTSFTGQDGHTYGFYSVATDNAGNVQATPTTAQTSTLVDVTPPTSSVTALPPYENTTTFAVSWSGSDGLHGSGVASYSIYVSDDGGTFTPLLTGTTLTSTSFTGQDGHTYGFYSVATDNAGNVQATPTTAQTSTLVDVTPPTSSVTALPPYENTTTFAVSWSGSDGLHGSGVASYSIYVSDDGGTFTPLLTGTTLTSTSFTGQDGHTYGFYSVATDNAGNVQATPTTAQTSTLVDVTPPTSSVTALPPYENTTTFAVSWSGSDGLHGSGVASYSIYVSDDGGTFTPLLTGTTLTSTSFTGQDGHTYGFYSVATDNAGNVQTTPTVAQATTQIEVAITVTIASVTSSLANGEYGTGEVLPISVTFTAPVIVGGTPQLALNALPGGVTAFYASGSGSSTLVFDYTIAAGQSSSHLDYASTTALTLHGGTIRDTGGNNANLTLPAPGTAGSLGANKNLVINTSLAPTALPFSAVEGIGLPVLVAAFTDADHNTSPNRYTATITWGDGHVSAAAGIVYDPFGKRFLVSGVHTYSEEGNYVVQVLIHDSDGASAEVSEAISVAEAPLLAWGALVTAPRNTGWVTVANFIDTGGPQPVADYAAVVNWGDSTATDSDARIVAGADGIFSVQGQHTYSKTGNYSVQVKITHETVSAMVTSRLMITGAKSAGPEIPSTLSPSAVDAVLAGNQPWLSVLQLLKLGTLDGPAD